MIEDLSVLASDASFTGDVAIVGAGPAGIVMALEIAKSGVKVLLLESGQTSFVAAVQDLSDAAKLDPNRHTPMSMAVRRQVGGTSVIWGGRCVPFDDVDFEARPFVTSASWPVTYEGMATYFQRACDWLVCGRAVFDASEVPHLTSEIVPGLVDGDVTSSGLERWSLPTDFAKTYLEQLRLSPNIRLLTGVTCVQVDCAPESTRAEALECRTMTGRRVSVNAKSYVIACGGLETTRLLMSSTGPRGGQLGNESGHLGRWYMGHVGGVIARAHFTTPPSSTVYDYERDIDGVYIRRRFGFRKDFQVRQELPNMAGWLASPEPGDARHKSGQLSFTYLALSSPLGPRIAPEAQRLSLTGTRVPGTPYGGGGTVVMPRSAHLANVLRQPVSTARFALDFGTRRFLARGRRAPGFFAYSPDNVYPLEFHGEHLPNSSSQVTLADERDALGMRRLNIDLRFGDADVDGVVRSHREWDNYLRAKDVGWLEYIEPDVADAVERRLGGGFHQIGTTRMSDAPSGGVVDKDLAVHGVENVYVASSSTFVTSGQANATFMIVAFALRLADHLRGQLGAAASKSLRVDT